MGTLSLVSTEFFTSMTSKRSLGFTDVMLSVLKIISPKLYWRARLYKIRRTVSEREVAIAVELCAPAKTSLDIGAANGMYAVRLCTRSSQTIAFEPLPPQAETLRDLAAAAQLPIKVEAVALSNHAGQASLRMLTEDAGRSTIEPANTLEDPDGSLAKEITVPKRRLDDYELAEVGFIKIDVEGHELAVLEGAERTIRGSMPALLIEIEERHRANAIKDVTAFMAGLGYEGFFVLDDTVRPIAQFDVAVHQDPANVGSWKENWVRRGIYVNNFFFLPIGTGNVLRAATAAAR